MAERRWASPDQAAVRILDGSSQIGTGCLIGGGLILTSEALVSRGGLDIISASSPRPDAGPRGDPATRPPDR